VLKLVDSSNYELTKEGGTGQYEIIRKLAMAAWRSLLAARADEQLPEASRDQLVKFGFDNEFYRPPT